MKILIMTDVHFCHSVWYGMDAETRMKRMVSELNRAYREDPYEAILFLGDYSLDFWGWSIGGCYVHEKYSYTERFAKEVLPQLACRNLYLLPGNHEQYSHADWKRITGFDRQYSVVIGDVLYLMLDNFAGELDPDYDSDGVYTGPDLNFIRAEMEKYPDLPVVLCAHYFDLQKENAAFAAFVKEQKRIVCLFCGHDHVCKTESCGDAYGGKFLFHAGNYSYAGCVLSDCMYGWREVEVQNGSLKTTYYTPKMQIEADGVIVECEDTRHVSLTLKL